MELTKQQLKELLPKNPYIDQWHNALSQLLPDYEINTPQRIAAFIAQCAHESGNFIFLSENLNYKAESLMKIFSKYFKDIGTAKQYEKNPHSKKITLHKRTIIYCNIKLDMNWCNKLTGNTCKLIIRIMSTLPTAAQRLYKKIKY